MYSNYNLRLFCELGFIKALGDLIQNYHRNSKFGGFLTKLEKEWIKIQKKRLPLIDKSDLDAAGVKLDRFGYNMNWVNQKKSPNFMFCFCGRLAEESRYIKSEKIMKLLRELLSYQEDRKDLIDEHYVEGDKAYTVWLSAWGESDKNEHDAEESKRILKKIDAEMEREEKLKQYRQKMYGK